MFLWGMDERYEDKTDDHEEKPGSDFFRPYGVPPIDLVGIEPDIHIGSDIFPDPYHGRDESKSEYQIHRVISTIGLIVDEGLPIDKEEREDNPPSYIVDKMMRKKVYINECSDQDGKPFFRVVFVLKRKYSPDSCDIASDS